MAGVGKRRAKKALEEILGKKQEKLKLVPALLGAYFNGQKTIVVANRPDFVWCRIRGSTSEVVQAFNETVANHYDLPILIYRDPNAPDIYKVYGRDIRQYDDWGGFSFGLPPHGRSHSFGGSEGNDPVWIYKRQYLPMLPRPVATGTMSIWIEPEFWLVLRFVDGFCLAGLFVVTESWLNARVNNNNRGGILAIYMVVNF
ncbi:hypothetical protein LCGC14_3013460, partial [marine sediment metagenome]